MNYLMVKNRKFILNFYNYELYWINVKYIISDFSLNYYLKYFLFLKLIRNKRKSIVKIHNRCFLTSRASSIYRFVKMSRIMLRLLALDGSLIGFRKASW